MLIKAVLNKVPKSCILIHGAWHASWVWRHVKSPIQKYGYNKVLTPDLPGHGNNINDNYKDITLKTYVDYITKLINSLSEPVVLVGHSMAGVIISQIAENIPNKIHKLVYVSGFIPAHQGSLIDEEKKAKIPNVALEVKIDELNYCISLKNLNKIHELFYNHCSDKNIKYAIKHFQKQPLLPFLDKISISEGCFGIVPKLYIQCTADKAIHPEDQYRMYSKVTCDVKTVDCDHSPFFSSQEKLIELIGNIAVE